MAPRKTVKNDRVKSVKKNPKTPTTVKSDKKGEKKSLAWMLGTPEPNLGYLDGLIRRWWQVAWPVVVVILLLYFLCGP